MLSNLYILEASLDSEASVLLYYRDDRVFLPEKPIKEGSDNPLDIWYSVVVCDYALALGGFQCVCGLPAGIVRGNP
jgi:hypothetical protein